MILESVSLYWLTDTYPRCIYPYREVGRCQRCACRWSLLTRAGPRRPKRPRNDEAQVVGDLLQQTNGLQLVSKGDSANAEELGRGEWESGVLPAAHFWRTLCRVGEAGGVVAGRKGLCRCCLAWKGDGSVVEESILFVHKSSATGDETRGQIPRPADDGDYNTCAWYRQEAAGGRQGARIPQLNDRGIMVVLRGRQSEAGVCMGYVGLGRVKVVVVQRWKKR